MKKKISAKILITQLVILCMTLFILPMTVKAENVSADLFLYNVHHTYEVDNDFVLPFRHKYEFFIHANHEVSGRFIISVTTPSGSSSHTWWCESGGEIYNNQIMDRSTGTVVYVTGQQDVKVTVMYLTDSAIDIMNVRSIQFSQTDLDGNPITTDQSLWSYVQKIEDHEVQLLAQAGFINDQLTDTRQKLTAISNLLTTTNTTLSSLLTVATNILTKVTSIDTAIQNIDNTIDKITYIRKVSNLYLTTDFSTFDTTNGSYNNTNYVTTERFYVPDIISSNEIIRFHTNVYLSPDRKLELWYRNSSGSINVNISDQILYETRNRFYIDVYFKIDLNNQTLQVNGSGYFYLKFSGNFTYYNSTTNHYLDYIQDNDIEYWNLLGYFTQYNFYKQQLEDNKSIIEKLSELIIGNTQTNTSVSNNDQSNQQFNQQQQQYDQIESTFQSSFTTDQEAVQQTFSNNSLTIFADTALWFTQQLNALYNASGQMKILFTIPLLLGLALFFIGRGSKVMGVNKLSDSESPLDKNH